MKQTYVPVTLDQYLNESKTITLKRGYGERQPVVVGSNAPIRNQILAYVAENQRVAKGDLKRFIAGLNEGSRNPNASAIMWLKRNEQFFVTESKEGQTFFKLSPVGKRLADRFVQLPSTALTEKKKEDKKDDYDFVDTKKGYPRKGIYDVSEEDEEEKCGKCGKDMKACECSESVTESRKAKIEAIIERIKAKRSQDLSEKNQVAPNLGGKLDPDLHKLLGKDQNKDPKELDNIEKELTEEKQLMGKDPLAGVGKTDTKLGGKLEKNLHNQLEPGQDKDEKELTKFPEEKAKTKINEAEEEEKKEDDELSFDDLDLGDEEKKEGEEKPEGEEGKEEKPEETEEDEKVEITEFIITVTNAEQAIKELDELGVPAEKVEDEEEHEEKETPEEEKEEHKEGESEEGKEEGEEKPEETGGLDLGEAAEGEETATEEKIKVSVDYWDKLKGWLEGKGYDIEELFGGEIEVEDETEEKPEDGEGTDDFELDLGDEGEGKEGESSDEFSLDLEEGTEGPIEDAPADTLADKIADKVAQKIVDKL